MYGEFFFILKSKYFFYSLILIIIHQTLIASSVVFLTRVIEDFQRNNDYKLNLIVYLFCMVFPYIPGILSFLSLQKWINSIHKKYLDFVFCNNKLDVFSFHDIEYKEKISSLLSRNSFQVINSTSYFIHDFISLFLNSFLSLIVFFVILPYEIFVGYVISLVLSTIIILSTKKIIEKKYYNIELNTINFGTYLNKFPENFSINNRINKKIWFENFQKIGEKYYDSLYSTQAYKQFINLVIAIIAMLPTSYLIYTLLTSGNNQPALLAAIIVNLTRIFTVLSSLNAVLSSFVEIPSLIGRLKILFDINDNVKKFDLKFINRVYINNTVFNNGIDGVEFILNKYNGRFTITGENGAGKTTLLNKIKDSLGTTAILVPTNLNNIVWDNNDNFENLSTGQKMKKILSIVSTSDEKYILLDEWDANLDKLNTQEIDEILNNLGKTKVVVEIRH